jgi:alanyl-tRNA synthetase
MQQHSGQHILSQAFVQACGAETRSFHLGSQTSTIDIELQTPTADVLRAAENIANAVVFEDRPMRVHIVNEDEAARLPLRKESAVQGDIRVIEVENFDWSPCGGTHAARTGQVGMIAIRSFERAKKMTRVEFVCGGRALADCSALREIPRPSWSPAQYRRQNRRKSEFANCSSWR